MEGKDWTIVFATIMGPILAVQAQKWIEVLREYRSRKMWVFNTLMATRLARLSLDHVRALNTIEMAFYGRHLLGVRRQTKSERAVCDSWQQYLADLSLDTSQADWARRDGLFANLLMAMASDVGFAFDRTQVTRSVYSPMAHGRVEAEQEQLRSAMLDVVTGRVPLKMAVTSFPIDEEAMSVQKDLQRKLSGVISRGSVAVAVTKTDT